MFRHRIALLSLSLCALSCGGEAAVDVSIADAEIVEAPWEASFSPDEMTVWREGVVRWAEDVAGGVDFSTLPPAVGATVELYAPHPHGRRPLVKLAEATVGPDGRIRIGPGPATSWVLRAQRDDSLATWAGRVPRMLGAFPLSEGAFDMLIRPGFPLEVALREADGRPAAGALVRAGTVAYEQLVETDSAGIARFRAPAGPIHVEAMDPGRRGAETSIEVPVPEGAEPTTLTAPDRGPLEGWVVDADTGAPLVGARVLHLTRPDTMVVTDADGRFALSAPRHGRIAAFGRGRGWRSYPVPAAGELEMRLGAAAPVRGRVVGPDGAGVAGARLTAVASNVEGAKEPVRGPVTGPDGSFEFDWMPRPPRGSGGEVRFVAHRRGLGWSSVARASEVSPEGVEMRLLGERSLTGSIQREGGAPCAGIDVTARVDTDILPPAAAAFLGLASSTYCRTTTTGEFTAYGLPAHLPTVVSFEFNAARVKRRVEPGGDAREDVVIPFGKAISGCVVDTEGQPVTLGGEARAELQNHPEFATLTRTAPIGPDGTFRIDDLPDGRYGIRGNVRTFDVGGAVADAGDADVELVAERPADLDFDLVFPVGAEQQPIVVRLENADDPAVPARTVIIDPADAASPRGFELVRRGRYHITAVGGVWRSRHHAVEIPDGRRPPMELVLERTLQRFIVLADADGQPLSGRRVIVAPMGVRGVRPEQYYTGEGGTVEIAGLAEGEWIARVVDPGGPPLERRFTVSADDRDEIRLRQVAHGTLEIDFDRDAFSGAADLIVSLRNSDGDAVVAWGPGGRELASRWRVPASGPLELNGIPAGAVTVVVSGIAGEVARTDGDVAAASRTTLRVPE